MEARDKRFRERGEIGSYRTSDDLTVDLSKREMAKITARKQSSKVKRAHLGRSKAVSADGQARARSSALHTTTRRRSAAIEESKGR